MLQVQVRLAERRDVDELIAMRRDFTYEDYAKPAADAQASYEEECRAFLLAAIEGERWKIFVAEAEGEVVSHMYVQLIEKVPRPGKVTRAFAYVTNVYTRPAYRGRGIGGQVQAALQRWAEAQALEFLLVWPSENSVAFYERHGFRPSAEALERHFD